MFAKIFSSLVHDLQSYGLDNVRLPFCFDLFYMVICGILALFIPFVKVTFLNLHRST